MPTFVRFVRSRITMYPLDHNPPHVHIVSRDFEVLVEIGTWKRIGGYGRAKDIAEPMAWAKANKAFLRAKWAELNPETGR